MKIELAPKDKRLVAAALVGVFVLAVVLDKSFGGAGLLVLLITMVALAIVLQIEVYRRLSESMAKQQELICLICQTENRNYTQLESLFSVFGLVRFNAPLPRMRGWSVSPDFLSVMAGLLRECKPHLVVELGSGVSTLVAGYLQKEWGGKVLSFDHAEEFANSSRREVRRHGLDDVVTVAWAPLREVTLEGRTHLWYEAQKLRGCGPIDFLIIDGPPGSLQKLARYPALPLLREDLARDAVILLDDAARDDEKRIVELWRAEMSDLEHEYSLTEKGAVILRRVRGVDRRGEFVGVSAQLGNDEASGHSGGVDPGSR